MNTMYQAPQAEEHIRPFQFMTVGKLPQVPAPLIRVTTCGFLAIEVIEEIISTTPPLARYVSFTPDQLHGRGTTPALTLLKLFLNRYARFASKDWLLSQFCRDGELYASARIENIVSILRGLLCPPAYQDLRTYLVAHMRGSTSSGYGYQLAPYPLVWVDSEALAWNVEQAARMERFGDDGLPFWERAYELAKRGPYLPDEMFSDWTTFRREEVQGMLRQCVQAQARLYVARHGTAGEEEALLLLRSFWQEHPHEEDVLRMLMELLGQRECYHEAMEYYEQLCQMLAAEESQPDAQTQDLAAYLRTKQIQHTTVVKSQMDKDIPFPQTHADDILPADNGHSATLLSVPLPGAGQSPLYLLTEQQLLTFAAACRLGEPTMFDPTKRKTVEALLAALGVALVQPAGIFQPEVWKPLLAPTTDLAKVNAETIQGLTHLLEACWQLSRGSELALAEELLPTCMAKIIPLAQQPSAYQQDAIKLAAQGFRLSGLFAFHRNDIQARHLYYQQAVQYSRLSGDQSLLVTALRSSGHGYYYRGKYPQALHVFHDALQYIENISPLQQACIYMSLAAAYAHLNQSQEAFTYLGLAQNTFPEHSETDPSFTYVEFDLSQMILWEGITRSQLDQTQQALEIFQQIEQPAIAAPERIRVEIINQQAKTAIFAGDLEQGSAYVEAGFKGAKALGSQRRYNEAYENFKQMSIIWPHEQRVKALGELLH